MKGLQNSKTDYPLRIFLSMVTSQRLITRLWVIY